MEQKWIPVEERLPDEHSSIFAKFNGTNKWRPGMFEKTSHNVLVTAVDEKGNEFVTQAETLDGKWSLEIPSFNAMCRVVAWMPLPEPYRTAPPEPHWKDRMMNTFLGRR